MNGRRKAGWGLLSSIGKDPIRLQPGIVMAVMMKYPLGSWVRPGARPLVRELTSPPLQRLLHLTGQTRTMTEATLNPASSHEQEKPSHANPQSVYLPAGSAVPLPPPGDLSPVVLSAVTAGQLPFAFTHLAAHPMALAGLPPHLQHTTLYQSLYCTPQPLLPPTLPTVPFVAGLNAPAAAHPIPTSQEAQEGEAAPSSGGKPGRLNVKESETATALLELFQQPSGEARPQAKRPGSSRRVRHNEFDDDLVWLLCTWG